MENCLQITDHWVTIVSGAFTSVLALVAVWLAGKTYILTKKDKQKTIAINELQLQTKKLEELYLYQIQPKFTVKTSSSFSISILNLGGDCYNLKISTFEEQIGENNPFIDWDHSFSSLTEKKINYKTLEGNNKSSTKRIRNESICVIVTSEYDEK